MSYSGTLPLSLLAFGAAPSGSSVVVNWKTAWEKGTKEIIVEHSTDGREWKALGKVMAAGNTAMGRGYSFTHTGPSEGSNFYRLSMQDIDGMVTFSHTASVYFGKASQLQLYPNPVGDELTLRTGGTQPVRILVFNAGGQPVKRALSAGGEIRIDVSGLAAGTYTVQIKQGNRSESLSFIKN